jgi:hypothetical protein
MKKLGALVVLLVVLSTSALAQSPSAAGEAAPGFKASSTVTAYATVLAVNLTTRELTMWSAAGDTVVVIVKPEVKTLPQVKPGDRIKTTYTEDYSIRLGKSGTTEMTHEKFRGDAKPGTTPSVSLAERTTYRATISAIDRKAGTATLMDPSGEKFTVTPLVPGNLARVKVGDIVVCTVTSSVAMSVEKAPAAKPAKRK